MTFKAYFLFSVCFFFVINLSLEHTGGGMNSHVNEDREGLVPVGDRSSEAVGQGGSLESI